jgi:hypothetical protein
LSPDHLQLHQYIFPVVFFRSFFSPSRRHNLFWRFLFLQLVPFNILRYTRYILITRHFACPFEWILMSWLISYGS